jgi:hypothetical protein
VDDLETQRNRIMAGFQTLLNMSLIWDRLRAAMRPRAEACIETRGGHTDI